MKGPAPGLRLPVQPVLLLTVLLCALAAWGLDALVSDMRTVELSLYNLRLGLLTSGRMDPSIVVAGVDRESLDRLGDWPFSRGLHARALRNLARDGARVVFFDFQFYDRGSKDPEGDERLVEAVRQTGLAILASRVSQSGGGYVLDRLFEPLNRVAEVAHINTRPDRDRAIRWAILALPLFHGGSIADARAYARAPKVPSAALALFARVQGVPASEIGFGQGAIRVGSKTVPTTWEGPDYHGFNYELPILFRGGLQTVSYWRLVDPGDPVHSSLKGKVVLVGQMLEGNEDDVFLTPAGKMKGVAVHAHVLDTLLSGWYLHPAPTWLDFVVLLIVCLDTGVTVERARSAVSSLLSLGLILVAYAGLNFLLFANRLWLDLATPWTGACLTFAAVWALRYFKITGALGQLVAREKVQEMLASDAAATLGGREEVVTVLFTDIRGYTTLSETRRPLEVLNLLNEYHGEVVRIYQRHGGTVLTYQGDAQLVSFGAPRKVKDPALAAVRAGLEMQRAVDRLRQKWGLQAEEFEVGCGICTGPVVLGLFGSDEHKQYTAVGDVVRLASSLQGQSARLQSPVLIDRPTWEAARGRLRVEPKPPLSVSWSPEPMPIYKVLGVK